MTKYVKAVECAEKISEKFGIPLGDLVDVFAEIPAADVAPRAEVEKIFDELMQKASLLVDRYNRLADDANDYVRIRHRGVECGASLVLLKISELKKKYTEGEK